MTGNHHPGCTRETGPCCDCGADPGRAGERDAAPTGPVRLSFHRSLIDWNDDGNITDYGWRVTLYFGGKHRAAWTSTRGTTRMWPGFSKGADEDCNRAVTLMLWPLGHLDVWWEPQWRPAGSGECDRCKAEIATWGTRPTPPAEGREGVAP